MVKCFQALFNILYDTEYITTLQLQHSHTLLKTLTAVDLMITVLWVVVPCSLIGSKYHRHLLPTYSRQMKWPAGSSKTVVPTKLCGITSHKCSILWWFSDLDSILLYWLHNVLNQLVTVGDGLVQILLNPWLLSKAPVIRLTDSILHVNEVAENCRISHQIQKLSHLLWHELPKYVTSGYLHQ